MSKKNIIISLLLTAVVVVVLQAPATQADTGGYQPGLQHLYPYYAPDQPESSSLLPAINQPPGSNLSSADYVLYFAQQQLGLNQQGSVVFAAALWHASQHDPAFVNGGRCGLVGWTCDGQRWNRFENFSQNHSLDPALLESQLLFINFELNNFGANDTPYQHVYSQLFNSSSFEDSSSVFIRDYLEQEAVSLSSIAQELYDYGLDIAVPEPPVETPPTAPVEPPPTETPPEPEPPNYQPNTIDCRAGTTSTGYIPNITAADSQGRYLQQLEVVKSTDASKTTITYVHRCLKESLEALFRDYNQTVSDPKYYLGGWVWRSHKRQIELREKHCGTSHHDVYTKSASECSPPTARPGKSAHQDGLAVDFYCQNSLLSKTNCNGAFNWLDCKAAHYGLAELSSESWHWYFPLNNPAKLTQELQETC